MKDKRLDVFFEHCSFRVCKHFSKDQGLKFCLKIFIDGFPEKTNCNGDIAKCELEKQ